MSEAKGFTDEEKEIISLLEKANSTMRGLCQSPSKCVLNHVREYEVFHEHLHFASLIVIARIARRVLNPEV